MKNMYIWEKMSVSSAPFHEDGRWSAGGGMFGSPGEPPPSEPRACTHLEAQVHKKRDDERGVQVRKAGRAEARWDRARIRRVGRRRVRIGPEHAAVVAFPLDVVLPVSSSKTERKNGRQFNMRSLGCVAERRSM